jgi:hypothetical protein
MWRQNENSLRLLAVGAASKSSVSRKLQELTVHNGEVHDCVMVKSAQ